MSNLENMGSAGYSINSSSSSLKNLNGTTRHSVSETLARDEELGYDYVGYATTIYPENSLS